jgi:hypothetical protein
LEEKIAKMETVDDIFFFSVSKTKTIALISFHKAFAAPQALKSSSNMNYPKLIIEGDALNVVQALKVMPLRKTGVAWRLLSR